MLILTLFKKYNNNIIINYIIVFLSILILKGFPVPISNENIYLLLPYKIWNSNFLLNDWTFENPFLAHAVFNIFISFFTLFFSVEALGWFGRVICWILTIIPLFKIGRGYNIPHWIISVSILLWIIQGQSIVGNEWVFNSFEAKSISYLFLTYALLGILKNRDVLSSILLGLTFSFHAIVGFWSILAVLLSMILMRYHFKRIIKIIFYISIASLPGIVFYILTFIGDSSTSMVNSKYIVLMSQPFHLDPFSWVKRDILLTYLLFIFNSLYYLRNKDNKTITLLYYFQFFLGIFFTLGLICRYFECYNFLRLYPCRLFPLFVLLFFFYSFMSIFYNKSLKSYKELIFTIGMLSIMSLKPPFGAVFEEIRFNYRMWTRNDNNLEKSLKWIGKNTLNGSIIIAPPWEKNVWYLSKRAQIANFEYIPLSRFNEWQNRIVTLVGKIEDFNRADQIQEMEKFYNSLTTTDIISISNEFGADYLISKNYYFFPVMFDSGSYKVYLITTNIK